MMSLLNRIAKYFADWDGVDETAPKMELDINDLRYIANMHIEKCRLEKENKEYRNLLEHNRRGKFVICPHCGANYNSADMELCWRCQQPLEEAYKPVITPTIEEVDTLLQSCAKKLGVNYPNDEEKIYGK